MFADDDELALAETAAAKNGNIHNDQVKKTQELFSLKNMPQVSNSFLEPHGGKRKS